jgi:hypothetical protein
MNLAVRISCVNTDVSIVCYRSVSEGSSLCINVLGKGRSLRLRLTGGSR